MSGSVRIFLRGYFQCSPDSFEPRMRSVELSSDALLEHINKGFEVIGAEAQTSNTAELAATDSQQPQPKICPQCNGTGLPGLQMIFGESCSMCHGTGKLSGV
jgi:DnaJ-class molecular chaperone